MKKTALIAILALGLLACEKDSLEQDLSGSVVVERNNGQPSSNCFNFEFTLTDAPLGFVCVPPIPGTGADPICGAGGLPGPITLGNISGIMRSVITGQQANGNGATLLTLMHYFEADGGLGAFWTNDHAVCAPAGNDPTQCRVNDVLDIVAGTGIFANAGGKFHNQGTLDFANGTLNSRGSGRVCGDGL